MAVLEQAAPRCQGRAVWFVGLPGSGKSTVAKLVHQALLDLGLDVVHLEMDSRRKEYIPKQDSSPYSEEERQLAYSMFIQEAADLVGEGNCVLMDGTAHRLALRQTARKLMDNFLEVHLLCSLDKAMEREAKRPQGKVVAGLYAKALDRRERGTQYPGLGDVIGVDVPFEQDPMAELRLDTETLSPEECADEVVRYLRDTR